MGRRRPEVHTVGELVGPIDRQDFALELLAWLQARELYDADAHLIHQPIPPDHIEDFDTFMREHGPAAEPEKD